jgi:hypothetical protein
MLICAGDLIRVLHAYMGTGSLSSYSSSMSHQYYGASEYNQYSYTQGALQHCNIIQTHHMQSFAFSVGAYCDVSML